MDSKPQIFLLAEVQPGLAGCIDRLKDVGYDFVSLDPSLKDQKGIAILPIGRSTDFTILEALLTELKSQSPDMEWMAIFTGRLTVKAHYLYGIGFNQLYQIPLDEEIFTNRVFELLPIQIDQKSLKFDHLLRVNLPFFKDLEKAPFDVFMYLPSNRRIVLYQREGMPLDQSQLEKSSKHKNHSLFIRKTDIKKYKDCTTEALGKISVDPALSEAHKMMQIQENMQILMSPVFTEGEMDNEEARQTIMQLNEVLKGVQISPKVEKETINSLERLSSQKMTNATHASNVAAYCALFGLALGRTDAEELRLGGLLHDVGLADLPIDLIGKDESQMNEEDRARYHLHPGNGRQDVLNRKVPVTDTILNMILFHHERPDGSGYPYGKRGDEIPDEAQICAFADEFDKLTSLRQGYKCYSAMEALLLLSGRLGEPAHAVYNPKIHDKIIDFYFQKHQPKESPIQHEAVGTVTVVNTPTSRPSRMDSRKLKKPVPLEQIAKTLPKVSSVSLTIDPDVEFEVMALERELEFYFLEK